MRFIDIVLAQSVKHIQRGLHSDFVASAILGEHLLLCFGFALQQLCGPAALKINHITHSLHPLACFSVLIAAMPS